MTRLTKPDTANSESSAPDETAPTVARAPDAATAPAAAGTDAHEPFPGAAFFHGGRNSPIVQAMARRLQQEGHWNTSQSAGPDWTNAHKRAFAAYQHELRPKEGGDVSGTPDEVAWDQLRVPRVSPRPQRKN